MSIVKPLEWKYYPDAFPPAWASRTPWGHYAIEEVAGTNTEPHDHPADWSTRWEVTFHGRLVASRSTLEEAKTAAQEECEQRILDSLSSEYADRIKQLEEALTPSADTKAAYAGEFYVGVTLSARGQEDYRRVQVPWTTIKEIMAAIRAYAGGSNDPR